MFAIPAGLKFVSVCCHVWGPWPKSDCDLIFGNVVCQSREPGTSSLLLHFSAEMGFFPRYLSPFSGEREISHPVWPTLLCRVFIPNKVFSLSLKALSQFCDSTLASLWVFYLVGFFTPKPFTYLWGWNIPTAFWLSGGTCCEAADGFPVAGHSLGEVSSITEPPQIIGSLSCSSLTVSAMKWVVAEVSRDCLTFECCRGEIIYQFFSLKCLVRCKDRRAALPVPLGNRRACGGAGWCTDRQTTHCEMQQVSVSNLCGCLLLKLTFGMSQHSKREKKIQCWNCDDKTCNMEKTLQQWSLSVLFKYFYCYLNFK